MDSLSAVLPWDSGFFGFRTARLHPAILDPETLSQALADLADQGVTLVYWAADPSDAVSKKAAEVNRGFLADEKTTYRIVLDAPPVSPEAGAASPGSDAASLKPGATSVGPGAGKAAAIPSIAKLSETDKKAIHPTLLALADRAGMHSRFRMDPRFPAHLCKALYEEWMRKSLSGEMADEILVAQAGAMERPQGMVTISASQGIGRIGLIAVAEGAEGRGMGTALTRAALAWFREAGCKSAEVVTQGGNPSACRIYEKAGFHIARQERFYHFWLDPRP